ncbi:MAG: peptidoglycan DD-metalloendopeptidase family protein [Anaerolineales bacterium]|nr:peptidoglycan DD-metalloendopeptidase family protein [Anaerolineales bacterium]
MRYWLFPISEQWAVNSKHLLSFSLLFTVYGLLLAACAPQTPTAPAGPSGTQFVQTRVAQILTESALTPFTPPFVATSTPEPSTATPTFTPTPAASDTPTITPTATEPPIPTLDLSRFPKPPELFAGEPHLWLARPIGGGGNVFIASNYRYGSTFNNQLETHHGVEFANPTGVPVVAVGPGTVYYAGGDAERQFGPQTNFYGNLVVLQLAQTLNARPVFALYGHLDQVLVTTGQAVNTGETLGTVGSSGVAYGPHLHFEVRVDNGDSYWSTRNPELWLVPGTGRAALAVRITNERGQHLPGTRVVFTCSDGAPRVLDTYWDPGVTPDDAYGENAAMTDVPAGYCKFEAPFKGQTLTAETTLLPDTLNFVWLKP